MMTRGFKKEFSIYLPRLNHKSSLFWGHHEPGNIVVCYGVVVYCLNYEIWVMLSHKI